MDIGFEVIAARPKGLRAEEPPAAESMRGARTLTKNPSTDQKKIRRQQQRKTASMDFTAALNDVGDCRLCGGDLKPADSQKGESTIRANCEDCGTEHHLQAKPVDRTASLEQVDERTMQRIANVETWLHIEKMPCPDCHSQGFGTKRMGGHSAGSNGFRWHVLCRDCGHHYQVADKEAIEHQRASQERGHHASIQALSLSWEPLVDTSKYVTGGKPLSAIARRAQSVSATPEENL